MSTWICKASAAVLTIIALAACGGGGGGGGTGNITPDGSGGASKIFLADSGNAVVISSANANPPPGAFNVNRTISGSGVSGLMSDIAYESPPIDRLYVANSSSIAVINNASTAKGNVIPARTIASSFSSIKGFYLNTSNDRLYVIDSPTGILVFDNVTSATTSTPPSRTISITRSSSTIVPDDIFVDTSSRDILYAKIHVTGGGGVTEAIAAFDHASTISGTVTSNREMQFTTTLGGIVGDATSDRLFAVESIGGTVMVFDGASTKDGVVAASRTITAPAPLQKIELVPSANRLYGIAVDTRTLYIVNNASTANGTVSATAVANSSPASVTGLAIAQ